MSMHRFRHKTPHHRPRTYSRLFSKAFRPRSRSVITTKGPWLNHTENINPATIKEKKRNRKMSTAPAPALEKKNGKRGGTRIKISTAATGTAITPKKVLR